MGGGGRIGSSVYGTVLVMAALTAAYPAERHHPWKLVELVITACVVFWLAYVYAHALSESIESRRSIGWAELGEIASRELGIVLAAVIPVFVLCLGAVGLIAESTSIWAAIAFGLVMLFVQLVANVAFGFVIVLLKVTLVH